MTTPAPPEVSTAPITSVQQLTLELAELLELASPDALHPDDDLLAWGLDSLRLMTLVERLRGAGVDTSFVELAEHPTLAGLARKLGLEVE